MSRLGTLARRALLDRGDWVFFRCDPAPGRGRPDPEARLFLHPDEVPVAYRAVLFPHGALSTMALRMRRGLARVMCFGDGQGCVAYVWVQDWRPFRRRFGMVAREGVMLGPGWTDPSRRGQGLYGRLIRHALQVVDGDVPILAAVAPDNVAPQRVLPTVGFTRLGRYRIAVVCGLWVRWSRSEA